MVVAVSGGDPAPGVGGNEVRGVSLIFGGWLLSPGVEGMAIESCREAGGCGGKDWFGDMAVGLPSGWGEPEKLLPPLLMTILFMVKPVLGDS
jgi:hypothetical protein